jgi:transposase-like protein
VCPHCGGSDPYKLTPKATSKSPGRKGLYKCRACRKQFTVTVGTVFEHSHIALSKWLLAIHLLASSKKGISAHQLHRNLGISYKGAWFMAHRLRWAMTEGGVEELLKGTVEIDEAYIGGKRKGGKGRRPADGGLKAPVVALIERGGKMRAFPLEQVTAQTMDAAILRHVDTTNARLMTDDTTIYGGRKRLYGADRQTVEHGRGRVRAWRCSRQLR